MIEGVNVSYINSFIFDALITIPLEMVNFIRNYPRNHPNLDANALVGQQHNAVQKKMDG